MPFQFLDQFFKTLEMELTLQKARKPLHVLTLTLLSLLLPLSFLLLARLSYASFLSTLSPSNLTSPQHPFLFSLFFHTKNYPNPIHAAVAALTIATLLHSLTSKIVVYSEESSLPPVYATHKPGLCIAWALLCAVQVRSYRIIKKKKNQNHEKFKKKLTLLPIYVGLGWPRD